jgi:hypothetical protein
MAKYFVAKVKEKKMANKKFWLAMPVMALAFGLALSGCDDGSGSSSSGGTKSVPSWAQGTWYTASSGTGRIKVAEITSSQYISYQVSGYDGSYKPIVSELMRVDCTGVNGDIVEFGGGLQIKKLSSSTQISIGQSGAAWVTVYK